MVCKISNFKEFERAMTSYSRPCLLNMIIFDKSHQVESQTMGEQRKEDNKHHRDALLELGLE